MKQIRSVISYLLLLLLGATGMATAQIQTRAVGDEGSPDDPTLICNVEVVINGIGGGTVSPNGKMLKIGDIQPFVVTAHRGWTISSVSVDGTPVTANFSSGTYTCFLKAAKNKHTLTVTFAQTVFRVNVTINPAEGGTVTPLSGGVKQGEDFSFTVRPAEGYDVKSVKAASGAICTDLGNGAYQLGNMIKDEEITVAFSANSYLVSVENGSGGILTSPAMKDYSYGEILTVAAQPNAGYTVDKITVNGVLLSGNTVKVTGNMVIKTTFKPIVHTVTVLSQEGGVLTAKNENTVYRNGSYSIPYGTTLNLEMNAATGYVFDSYTLGTNTTSDSQVTITSDLTIGAVFNKRKYKVTVTAPDVASGKLLVDGMETSSGEINYPYGTVLTLGNQPGTNKTFSTYSVTPPQALNGNQVTVTSDISIEVAFKAADIGKPDSSEPDNPDKVTYPVTFPSGVIVQTADGTITSGTYVKKDTELTIIVSNTSQQELASLAVNGSAAGYVVSGNVNIGYYKVTGATDIQPVFRKRSYKVVIETPVGGRFDVTTGGKQVVNGEEVAYGTQLTVTATPTENYKLEYILANTLDITLSGKVTVTEDVVLNLFFRPQSGFNPNPTPDPTNPDAGKPVSVDQTLQQVVYNREVQAFRLVTLPAGVLSGVMISYSQKGASATPKAAGRYDVVLKRPADATMSELNISIPGGLEILKAPVSIQSLNITEDPVIGPTSVTEATLKGGVASYLNKEVKGSFTWVENGTPQLSAGSSAYHAVRFVPDDQANYLETTTQHFIQVGTTLPSNYQITWSVQGTGDVNVHNGSMSVSPDATFFAGTVLTLEAVGKDGYRFVRHETDFGSYSDNPIALVVNSDLTVKSVFEKKKEPAVTIDNPVNLVYNGQAKLVSLSSVSVQTGWQIEYKDTGGKTVIPRNAGQYTVYVTRAEDKEWQAVSKQYRFTISKATPTIDVLPIASPVQKGAVLGDSRLTGGVASVIGLGVVPGGFSWKDISETMSMAGTHQKDVKFTPTDPDNIFSVFLPANLEVVEKSGGGELPVIITYDMPSNGTLLVTNENGKTIKSGEAVNLGNVLIARVTAAGGYRLSSLTIGGIDYTAQAMAGSGMVSFSATASKHLYAEFVKIPDPDPEPSPGPDPTPDYYTVWVMSSGRGSILPGTTEVSPGSNKTFAIVPDEGFNIIDVRVNGRSVGVVSSYTFSNIWSDQTLEAVFSSVPGPVGKSYTLTARVADEGGIVSPSLVRVTAGGKQTFLIVPNEGNKIQRVLVGRSELDLKEIGTPSAYTFANVHSDSILVVYFSIITGVQKVEVSDFRVYTENNVLYMEAEQPQDVMVVDMAGVIRYISRISAREAVFGLIPGIYIVSSKKDGRQKSIKVRIK